LVGVQITLNDISISHRLPSRRRSTPHIIAKFTNRRTKDLIYQNKGKLRSRSSSDIGYANTDNELYINESLTPRAKELYFKVREFRNAQMNFDMPGQRTGNPF